MSFLLTLLALGGVYYFYVRAPSATGGGGTETKQLPAGDLDVRFEAALKDMETDPLTREVFKMIYMMMSGVAATDAQVDSNIKAAGDTMRKDWADKEPHALADHAMNTRSVGAEVLAESKAPGSKVPGDGAAFARKARVLSDILREKIESLTKQGKNLDLAFKEVDAFDAKSGKEPSLSKAAEVDAKLIDKAALSPLLFRETGVTLGDSYDEKTIIRDGEFFTVDNVLAGSGSVTFVRRVGEVQPSPSVKPQEVFIGKVVSFKLDKPVAAGSYFGEGTHVYASLKLPTA